MLVGVTIYDLMEFFSSYYVFIFVSSNHIDPQQGLFLPKIEIVPRLLLWKCSSYKSYVYLLYSDWEINNNNRFETIQYHRNFSHCQISDPKLIELDKKLDSKKIYVFGLTFVQEFHFR